MARAVRSAVRRALGGVLVVGVIAPVAMVTPASAAVAEIEAASAAEQLNSMFATYGDTSGDWNGADSTDSVTLPDGRVVWLFSDTFLGQVNADGSRPSSNRMVHNTAVVQSGNTLTDTLYGGTPEMPLSWAGSAADADASSAGYWVAGGHVEGDTLKVLYNEHRKTGDGSLDITFENNAIATFALPSLELESFVEQPAGVVAWGQSFLEEGGFTYVYGTEGSDGMKFAHVARVPAGGLSGDWEYWTGSGWSGTEEDSARLMSGVNTAYSVEKIGGEYVLVTTEGNLPFNADVVAYTAQSPTGPFDGPTVLFTAPEPAAGENVITYDARIHQDQAAPGSLLISYNVNSLDLAANFADASLYRPRFVEVGWPVPEPDPATVPATPTGLSGTSADDGVVTLSWDAVAGADRYWIYQKDVTAGQTHFVRNPNAVTEPRVDLHMLRTGHTYEFTVVSADADGESPQSAPIRVTPRFVPPAAPSGVTATAQADGTLQVSWDAVSNAWGYSVYRRDVTAGETEFSLGGGSSTTSTTLSWLEHNHEYEVYVTAKGGGGESPPSATATATVRYPEPGVPTGLTATSNADGTITLNWAAPSEDLWYWVYQRDVTAGDEELIKLSLPTTNTTMTAAYLADGHEYEFAVASNSRAGDSAPSAPVRATSHYPVPDAPTNLTATPGNAEVTLSWTGSDPDAWYEVYQRDVTDGETAFTKLPLPITGGTTMTAGYLLNGHTYEFKVTASVSGRNSAASNVVRATPQVPLPVKVTGVAATAKSDGSIAVTWNAQDDVYYWVYQRDATAGQSWQRLSLPTDKTTFTADYLTHGHLYEFKVVANNSAGDGPVSDAVSARSDYAPPPAPKNLVGLAAGGGSIDLDWESAGPGMYYWVYHRDVTAGASFTKGSLPTDKTSATLSYLVSGHVYEYKVTAENVGGEGPASNTVRVTAKGGLPNPPTSLSATPGNNKVTLRWTASTTDNVFYWIEYRKSGGTWQKLENPISTCCTFTVDYLANGTTYDFRVRANNASGDSAASNVVSAKPMPPSPAAPTNLSATAGDNKVTLRWTASATNDVLYWIEYRKSGGNWQKLQYPISTCCTFTVDYLANGTTYDFRVKANNLSGDSAASNVDSARPMPPFPQPPSGLNVTRRDENTAVLKWNASPTADVWYYIEYRINSGTWKRLEYPDSTCCSFVHDYLTPLKTYEYRVRATNLSGTSAASNTDSVYLSVAAPDRPANLTVTPRTGGNMYLDWDAVSTATGYSVQVRQCGATSWLSAKSMIPNSSTTIQFSGSGCLEFRVIADRMGVYGPASYIDSGYVASNDYPERDRPCGEGPDCGLHPCLDSPRTCPSYILDGRFFVMRQCDAFAAWRVKQHFISAFWIGWKQDLVPPIMSVWGPHAASWDTDAAALGIPVNGTAVPGSIAQWNYPPYGHVAFVLAKNGNTLVVEEYNYSGPGQYGVREVTASDWPDNFIHFQDY